MRKISPREALGDYKSAIVSKDGKGRVYELYKDVEQSSRVCADLNRRYGDVYEVAEIDREG